MNTDTIRHPKIHHGRILGAKQETIATELDITQHLFRSWRQKNRLNAV